MISMTTHDTGVFFGNVSAWWVRSVIWSCYSSLAHFRNRTAEEWKQDTRVSQLCPKECRALRLVCPLTGYSLSSSSQTDRDIISSARLARGRSYVLLKVFQALKFCFVIDTHLVYSPAMSLSNLSVGTQEKGKNSPIQGRTQEKNDKTAS